MYHNSTNNFQSFLSIQSEPFVKDRNSKASSHSYFGKCKVCKDKATGIHYGIPSCEGCKVLHYKLNFTTFQNFAFKPNLKGFFKRSIEKNEKYVCYFGYKCVITPQQRKRCKYCRWRSCLDAGMSFEGIKMGRIPKIEKERAMFLREDHSSYGIRSLTTKKSHRIFQNKFNFQDEEEQTEFTETENESLNENRQMVSMNKQYLMTINDILKLGNLNILDSVINSSQLIKKSQVQDIFLNASDEDNLMILTLLRNKCVQVFSDFTHDIIEENERVNNLLKNGHRFNFILNSDEFSTKIIWKYFLEKLKSHLIASMNYCKQLPGFDSLSQEDFKKAVSDRVFELVGFRTCRACMDHEYYIWISDSIQFNKETMVRIFGPKLTQGILDFHQKFKELNLCDTEIACLVPYVLTSFDHNIGFSVALKQLNDYYSRLLFYELSLNKRNIQFYNRLKEVIALLPDLNKMNREVNMQFM